MNWIQKPPEAADADVHQAAAGVFCAIDSTSAWTNPAGNVSG
jgi:hypothetical protein